MRDKKSYCDKKHEGGNNYVKFSHRTNFTICLHKCYKHVDYRCNFTHRKRGKKKIKKDDRAHHQWWWLRSPGTRNCDVAYVRRDGTISPDGRFAEDAVTTCVRPALIIKTTFFEIGDTFEINGYHFKMITKNRAWLYSEDLGNFIFNTP